MYATYADLLCELFRVSDVGVVATDTVLSNFTVDAGGDTFDFTGGTPVVGDAITQAGNCAEIIGVTGSTVRIDTTGAETKIVEGAAKFLHSDVYPKVYVEFELQAAQTFIEEQTRQWFEPRSKTVRLEGKNSNVVLLRVPIISISEIRLNDQTEPQDLTDFEIYSGVDFRRKPMIKIRTGSRSIFTTRFDRTFRRGVYTEFDGVYGFVEEDGSTPYLIKKATMKLTINAIKNPIGSGAGSAGIGPLKREETDRHEVEYFQPDDVTGSATGAISGDVEVDRILKMYRGPTHIGGTIMDLPRVEDIDRGTYEYEGYY